MKKKILTAALVACLSTGAFAITPEELLPSGHDSSVQEGKHGAANIRKGSILSFIKTISFLNEGLDSTDSPESIIVFVKDLKNAIKNQDTLGTFKFFPVSDWLSTTARQGNLLAGLYYLQLNPEEVTEGIRAKLKDLKQLKLNKIVLDEIEIILS